MGGNKIAEWKNGKVVIRQITSRSEQTVSRALKKMTPKNLLAATVRTAAPVNIDVRFYNQFWKAVQPLALPKLKLVKVEMPNGHTVQVITRIKPDASMVKKMQAAMQAMMDKRSGHVGVGSGKVKQVGDLFHTAYSLEKVDKQRPAAASIRQALDPECKKGEEQAKKDHKAGKDLKKELAKLRQKGYGPMDACYESMMKRLVNEIKVPGGGDVAAVGKDAGGYYVRAPNGAKTSFKDRTKFRQRLSEMISSSQKAEKLVKQLDSKRQGSARSAAESGDSAAYKAYFAKKLKKWGIKSPKDLDDAKKRKFFEEVDKGWKSKAEGNARVRKAGNPRELKEMESILKKHGYDPKDAKKLQQEGIGPEELADRAKVPGKGVGSLEHSHSLKRKGGTRKAKKPGKPQKLTPAIRNKVARDFKKAGLDGNGRFRKPQEGYSKAVDILGKYGIELGGIPDSHRFNGDKGSVNVDLAWTNKEDVFSPVSMNSMLVISFFKMDNDRFEVLAYLS